MFGRSLAWLLLLAPAWTAACAGSDPPPPPEAGRQLGAQQETIWIRPGGAGTARFVLTTLAGLAVPGEAVTFAIVEDPDTPGAEAQGATLASARAATDATGVAEARVVAGQLTTFRVRAQSTSGTEAETVVVVAPDVIGSVDVAPFFPPGSRAAPLATVVEVLFFENGACVDISPRRPPVPVRPPRRLAPGGGSTRFDFVTTAFSHAVLGRARDGSGALLALGCVDLPGRALITGGTVQVSLPMADADPDPVGTFAATSRFALWPSPAASEALAAPWRDLGDCPLDPAQLWLDVTVEALGSGGSGDAALKAALAARRGTALPSATTSGACRGPRDAGGAPSADALVLGLFGSPAPRAVVELPALGVEAARLLDAITIRSQLDVRAGGRDGFYQVTHTLADVVFGAGAALKEVTLQPLGLPALSATTAAEVRAGELVVVAHGMTLRLGSAARVAFGTLGLGRRALPSDAAGFVRALADLARTGAGDGAPRGCAALDELLCADAGRAAGCLAAACEAGLVALGRRLDAAFDAADGAGLDLLLEGQAPLYDRHGNGAADRVGDLQGQPGQPGWWSATFTGRSGSVQASGEWEAVRAGN